MKNMVFLESPKSESKMFINVSVEASEVIMRNNHRASICKDWEISGNAEAEVSEAGACDKKEYGFFRVPKIGE